MAVPSPQYEQVRHGTLRNRGVAWLAAHSYAAAAARGAGFMVPVILAGQVVREIERHIPGSFSLEPSFSVRALAVTMLTGAVLGAVVMLAATASARGIVRLYVRARTGRGLTSSESE